MYLSKNFKIYFDNSMNLYADTLIFRLRSTLWARWAIAVPIKYVKLETLVFSVKFKKK